jgi:hypothetical protein
MDDDEGTAAYSSQHFGFLVVSLSDFHALESGASSVEQEDPPAVALPGQAADRHFDRGDFFPDNRPHLDPIAIAEHPRGGRILERDDHVDALFLDAECRNLGEPGRLDAFDVTDLGDEGDVLFGSEAGNQVVELEDEADVTPAVHGQVGVSRPGDRQAVVQGSQKQRSPSVSSHVTSTVQRHDRPLRAVAAACAT